MRIRLSELRRVVRTLVREELNVDKPYTGDLMDDEAFNSDSVLVPGDIKDKIRKWSETMLLHRRHRAHPSKKR